MDTDVAFPVSPGDIIEEIYTYPSVKSRETLHFLVIEKSLWGSWKTFCLETGKVCNNSFMLDKYTEHRRLA